jgi:peptidoglycan/xylan/chitin deacetylase (PgdA/CDA1 family)
MTAITFDDGFAGLYHHAMPTLRRTGLPVTVFLVAETLTARGRPVDWASPPPQTGTLTLDQVLEMKEAGVTFGSHSYSHHDLTGLPEDTVTNDLRASRELLADLLGEEIRFLAYPGGRHNEAVRRAARAAGFTHGFTLPDKAETPDAFAIPRVGVYPGNGTMALRIKSSQLYLSARPMAVFPALRSVARWLSRPRASRD